MQKENSKYCGCLYYSASALGRVITKLAEEEFAITGLAPSYAMVLISVNEKPGIQPKEISEHMQLSPSTVTRLVEKLEHRGFVTRAAQGRCTAISPTEKSLKLDSTIREAWGNLHRRYMELLGEAEAKQLTEKIYEATRKLSG